MILFFILDAVSTTSTGSCFCKAAVWLAHALIGSANLSMHLADLLSRHKSGKWLRMSWLMLSKVLKSFTQHVALLSLHTCQDACLQVCCSCGSDAI